VPVHPSAWFGQSWWTAST